MSRFHKILSKIQTKGLILKNINDVVCGVDSSVSNYIFVAGACYNIFGYTPEEYIKIAVKDMMPPESYQLITEIMIAEVGKYEREEIDCPQVIFEIQQYRKDGSLVWVEISAKAIINRENKIVEIVATIRNIEDRKKIETALKESEAKYEMIIKNTRDIIWAIDFETQKYTFINEICEEITGFSVDEYLNMTLKESVPPESYESIMELINSKTKEYKIGGSLPQLTHEVQLYDKRGGVNWVEVYNKILTDDNGKFTQLVGVTRNINDRKANQLTILEQKEKLEKLNVEKELILDNINDMICRISLPALNFVYVTSACYNLFGYTPEEYVQMSVKDVTPPESYQLLTKTMVTDFDKYKQGEIDALKVTFEIQQYHKDGSLVWVEVSARTILNKKNEPIEIISVTRSIEEKKAAELTILKQREKLEDLNAENEFVLNNINDMICKISLSALNFIYVAGACYNILGYTPEEYTQLSIKDVTPPESYQSIKELIDINLIKYQHGEIDHYKPTLEIQQYRKDGSLVWVEISGRVVLNEKNGNTEIVAMLRNIEERKATELTILKQRAELERLNTEKKFVLDNINGMICRLNLSSLNFTFVSGGCYNLFGYTPEEYTQLTLKDVTPPEAYQSITKAIATDLDKFKRGEVGLPVKTTEIQQYHKDGSPIWVEISSKAIFNEKNEPIDIISITRSIEEKKATELTILEQKEKLEKLNRENEFILNNVNDIISIVDLPAFNFRFITGRCYDLFGYTPEEYMQMTIKDVMLSESYQLLIEITLTDFDKFKQGEIDYPILTFETQIYHKNGSLVWVEISSRAICNEKNEPTGIIAVVRSITERKASELKILEQKEKLERQYKELKRLNDTMELLLNNMNDMVCRIDLTTLNFTFVNRACYNLFGYTPEEYTQLSVKDVTTQESYQLIIEAVATEFDRYKRGEIDYPRVTFEIQQYHKDGSLVWVEISARAALNEKNELNDIISITRSIEERKAIEFKILEQKEELERLNAQKNKFFSIIGHDLKNPIASLVYMSDFLKNDYKTKNETEIEDDILMINSSAKRIQSLLENLLEWARSSMGKIVCAPARNDLIQIINNCVGFLQVQANFKNISITIKFPDYMSECYVDCDANMVLTIIRNLVSNAIKFSPFDNIIIVSIGNYSEDNNYVQVSVKDSGVGISPENIDKLFKIDEKIISTEGTAQETGTGLGLILCKEFIDKHNCKIWVESEIGKGTTFSFTLPKAQSIY